MQFFLGAIVVCSLIAISIGLYETILWHRVRSHERIARELSQPGRDAQAGEPVRGVNRRV
jgi:hypothetical protein